MRARKRVRELLQTPHRLVLSHTHAHKLKVILSLSLSRARAHTHTQEQSWGEEFRDALALPKNARALDEVGCRCVCARAWAQCSG